MSDRPDTETDDGGTLRQVEIAAEDAGQRLDRILALRLDGLSRARVQALIRAGEVTCGGRAADDGGVKVKAGEIYAVRVPPPVAASPAGETMPLAIVYEDDALIVIDKPAGLVVHPAAGHASGTLVNALIAHCGDSLSGIGGVRRPGIVHRLDKDTTGLLVVAKTDAAHQSLSEQFAAHGADGRLMRSYLAVCWGVPSPVAGRIEADLARSRANRTKIAAVAPGRGGRAAVTHYEVLETFDAGARAGVAALARLVLETGRTHQIRVHFAHVGHPLLGDVTYGAGFKASAGLLGDRARDALAGLGRQALHAAELGFEHPVTGEPMLFASPLPADLTHLLDALRPAPAAEKPKPARRAPARKKPAG